MKVSPLARTFKYSVLSAAIALVSLNTSAALYDRGNGMIYDSTQNITWLQDANYVLTSGYDTDGYMTWQQSTNWAANLVYGGYSDWRLASVNNANVSLGELAYMFTNYNPLGLFNCSASLTCSLMFPGLVSGAYWYGEEYSGISFVADPASAYESYFPANTLITAFPKSHELKAWAVRNGDILHVSEVPVPAAAWLMGSGLLGLAGLARRKK